MAALPLPRPALPAATYLWWKAQLLRQFDAQRRAVEPIEVGEQIGVGIGLTGAGALLIWLWRQLAALDVSSAIGDAGTLTSLPGLLVTVVIISTLLVSGAAALAALTFGPWGERD